MVSNKSTTYAFNLVKVGLGLCQFLFLLLFLIKVGVFGSIFPCLGWDSEEGEREKCVYSSRQ